MENKWELNPILSPLFASGKLGFVLSRDVVPPVCPPTPPASVRRRKAKRFRNRNQTFVPTRFATKRNAKGREHATEWKTFAARRAYDYHHHHHQHGPSSVQEVGQRHDNAAAAAAAHDQRSLRFIDGLALPLRVVPPSAAAAAAEIVIVRSSVFGQRSGNACPKVGDESPHPATQYCGPPVWLGIYFNERVLLGFLSGTGRFATERTLAPGIVCESFISF